MPTLDIEYNPRLNGPQLMQMWINGGRSLAQPQEAALPVKITLYHQANGNGSCGNLGLDVEVSGRRLSFSFSVSQMSSIKSD